MIAQSHASVLITGERGTGKDLIASLIHYLGAGVHCPFVTINAASFPTDMIDSELFGSEKEMSGGAVSKKAGCFERAQNGTLFLEEIAEMHPQTQAKLLRVIEQRSFRRLGGKVEISVEARIIASTSLNIRESLASGALREDLFYRLSVIEIPLPALRDRKEDIPHLVNYFTSVVPHNVGGTMKRFSDECIALMMDYDWSGNVRELRNVVERALLICDNEIITPKYLPERISGTIASGKYISIPIGTTMNIAEHMLIDQTLASVDNNKSAAARILGLSRKTLHNKLNERKSEKC